jgi:clan AA aspartic protease (TIGR02281 family)
MRNIFFMLLLSAASSGALAGGPPIPVEPENSKVLHYYNCANETGTGDCTYPRLPATVSCYPCAGQAVAGGLNPPQNANIYTRFPAELVTYYDCLKEDGQISYGISPCREGEAELRNQVVNIAIYYDKEWVGANGAHKPLKIQASPNGMYIVPGSINGHQAELIWDTGASGSITLSEKLAAEFGVSGCNKTVRTSTANGAVDACVATIKEVSLAGVTLTNVEAWLSPNMDTILIGADVRRRFKESIEKDVMTIRFIE